MLVPTAAAGIYVRDARFSRIMEGMAAAIQMRAAGAERLRFSSVMARSDLQRLGYFRNFPDLLGTVHCFCGDEARHRDLLRAHDAGEDWSGGDAASDLVLTPAACYPVYPALAARGAVPLEGHTAEVVGVCFRREPSQDLSRLQSFQMQEVIHVGSPETTSIFRDDWLEKAAGLLRSWGLESLAEPANDPFFGRAATVMNRAQRAQALKFEFRLPITSEMEPTACVSVNSHLDGFARALGLSRVGGGGVHSACVGFGLERLALALLRTHGLDQTLWPVRVLRALTLD